METRYTMLGQDSNSPSAGSRRYGLRLPRVFLALILGVSIATPVGAQIAYVQGKSGTATSATSITLSLGSPQTAGNLNVVAIGWNDTTASVVSVTDTKGNVYVRAFGPTTIPGTASLSIYYAKNIQPAAANANLITVTLDQAASYPDFRIAEYSGIDPSDPLDAVAGASGTGTQLSSGTATTTSANTLLIGANYIQTGTNGVGAGFTQRLFTGWSHILADRIVTSAGPYEATASQYGDGWWLMQMAAFKAAPSGGGGGNPQAPLTMGVTTVLPSSDSGNGNYLSVQQATLTQTATIQSISFYVNSPAGSLRLGVYDATGPSGGPGNKVAETNSFTTVAGWNTANVIAPVQLSAGTYWLAHLPSSSSLSYPIQWYSGTAYAFSYTFGPMPGAYGTSHSFYPVNWSIYATLTASGDAQAPTSPSNLTADPMQTELINLSWTASTDNVGVTGYKVERCTGESCTSFAEVGTPTGTSFDDTGLTASTTYRYRVRATDVAGNLSSYSSIVSATTEAGSDTQPPTAPTNLSATGVSSSQINLSWTASTDDVGVTGYQVERCQGSGCSNFAQVATPTGTTFIDSDLSGLMSYSYRVRAVDAAGNLSAYSNTASATTQAPPDTQAPTAPSGLGATVISTTQVDLNWTASTDNVGVMGYRVERCQGSGCSNFAQIVTAAGTTFGDTGLTGSTSYTYRVRAVDAAGNLSAYSLTVTVSTPAAPDVEAPTVPSGLSAASSSFGQIDLSWTPSTDNVGVASYLIERCIGVGCASFLQIATTTATSYSDSGLTESTSYTYRVRAVDSATNVSGYSNMASASTPAAPDTEAPTVPSGLSATSASSSQINLSWIPSSDNVGVTEYFIERCTGAGCTVFSEIASSTVATYIDAGLAPSTSYSYRVRAADAASNVSGYSPIASAATNLNGPITYNYTYDDLGRLTRVMGSDGSVIDYTYDVNGNTTSITRQ